MSRARPTASPKTLALALVALLVLAGAAFAALPGVRDAVLEFFGLQGATVERRATLPPAPPPRRRRRTPPTSAKSWKRPKAGSKKSANARAS